MFVSCLLEKKKAIQHKCALIIVANFNVAKISSWYSLSLVFNSLKYEDLSPEEKEDINSNGIPNKLSSSIETELQHTDPIILYCILRVIQSTVHFLSKDESTQLFKDFQTNIIGFLTSTNNYLRLAAIEALKALSPYDSQSILSAHSQIN